MGDFIHTHVCISAKFAILGPGGGRMAITSCVTRKEVLHSYGMFLRLFIYYVMDDGWKSLKISPSPSLMAKL